MPESRLALYEMLYILDAALDEAELQKLENDVKAVISASGGELLKESNWGRRKLEFEIRKKSEGIYINLDFNAHSNLPAEMNELVRTREGILRHMCFRVPKAKLIQEQLDIAKKNKELERAEKARLEAEKAEAEKAAAAAVAAAAAAEAETVEETATVESVPVEDAAPTDETAPVTTDASADPAPAASADPAASAPEADAAPGEEVVSVEDAPKEPAS